jgi:hypothetical protein
MTAQDNGSKIAKVLPKGPAQRNHPFLSTLFEGISETCLQVASDTENRGGQMEQNRDSLWKEMAYDIRCKLILEKFRKASLRLAGFLSLGIGHTARRKSFESQSILEFWDLQYLQVNFAMRV